MTDYKPGEELIVSNMQSDFRKIFNAANLLIHDSIPELSTGQFVHEWIVSSGGSLIYTGDYTVTSEPLSSTSEQYFASLLCHDPSITVDDTYIDKFLDEIARLQNKIGK